MKEKMKKYFLTLFWIFVIASFLGCILETIVCIVQKGHFEVRQGVIYGPFIPVYGAGAVVFYICIPNAIKHTKNRNKKTIWIKTFLYSFLLGGVTEYLFSYCQECLFGTISWEYSHLTFNLNGRTSLLHCMYWGTAGILLMKFLYPCIGKIEEWQTSDKNAKIVTIVALVFMTFNVTISTLAGQRQYERTKNIPPNGKIDFFLDKHYPDSIMDIIFSNKQCTSELKRK